MTQVVTKNSTPPSEFAPGTTGGNSNSGGGGGGVTIADGADIAQGATTAAAYASDTGASDGTVVGLLKGLFARFTASNGKTDAVAYASADGTGAGSMIGILKGLFVLIRAAFGALPAGTDRSGQATTTSGGYNIAANANRRGLIGQNVGAVSIGFNEFDGVAVIGAAGTFTVAAGSAFSINTNRKVNFVAASGTCNITCTEF